MRQNKIKLSLFKKKISRVEEFSWLWDTCRLSSQIEPVPRGQDLEFTLDPCLVTTLLQS